MKMGSSLLIPKTYLNEFLYASKYSNYNHTLLLVNLKLNVKIYWPETQIHWNKIYTCNLS